MFRKSVAVAAATSRLKRKRAKVSGTTATPETIVNILGKPTFSASFSEESATQTEASGENEMGDDGTSLVASSKHLLHFGHPVKSTAMTARDSSTLLSGVFATMQGLCVAPNGGGLDGQLLQRTKDMEWVVEKPGANLMWQKTNGLGSHHGFYALVPDALDEKVEKLLLKAAQTIPNKATSLKATRDWDQHLSAHNVMVLGRSGNRNQSFCPRVFMDLDLAVHNMGMRQASREKGSGEQAKKQWCLVYCGKPVEAQRAPFSRSELGHRMSSVVSFNAVVVRRCNPAFDYNIDVPKANPITSAIYTLLFEANRFDTLSIKEVVLSIRSQVLLPYLIGGRSDKCYPVCERQLYRETGWGHFAEVLTKYSMKNMIFELSDSEEEVARSQEGIYCFGGANCWMLPTCDLFVEGTLLPAVAEYASTLQDQHESAEGEETATKTLINIEQFFNWLATRGPTTHVDDESTTNSAVSNVDNPCKLQRTFSAATFLPRLVLYLQTLTEYVVVDAARGVFWVI